MKKENLDIVSNTSTNKKFGINEVTVSKQQSQELISKINSSSSHRAEIKNEKVIIREFLRD